MPGRCIGDQVTLSIYYDRTAQDVYVTAVDQTPGSRAANVMGTRREFIFAAVGAGGRTWSLASSDTRL